MCHLKILIIISLLVIIKLAVFAETLIGAMQSSESLWESLLRESSKRSKVKEGTLIFVGDDNSGKISLASAVSNVPIERSSIELPSYVMMSSNDDLDDEKDKMQQNDGDFTKLHGWVLTKSTVGTFGKVILQNPAIERVGVVITLDFSDYSNCISVLKEWLVLIQREVLSALPPGIKTEQNQANSSYIDLCSRHRGSSEKLKQELVQLDEDSVVADRGSPGATTGNRRYCGIPIVVVGCKADVLDEAAYKTSANEVKEVQAYIRFMCLELGASFVMTATAPSTISAAAVTPESSSNINISLLRKFLFHSLFPSFVSLDLRLTDQYREAFVPAGLDSNELISLSCVHRGGGGKSPTKTAAEGAEKEKSINGSPLLHALALKLAPDAPTDLSAQALLGSKDQGCSAPVTEGSPVSTKSAAEVDSTAAVTLEDEQEWLTALYNQLLKHGASGAAVMDTEQGIGGPGPTNTKAPSPAPGRTATPTPVAGSGSPAPDGAAAKVNSPGRAEPTEGASGSTAAAGIATVAPKPSRRASTRAAAAAAAAGTGAGGQDPTDFFKNLLTKK